jgi:uncharacterized protein YkwD
MFTLTLVRGRLPLLAAVALIVLCVQYGRPGSAHGADAAVAILDGLNAARAEHGAPPLRADRRLALAARRHARDMVAHHFFSHESPSGERPSSRIARTGWLHGRRHWRLGENLAWGRGCLGRPGAIVTGWLRSPAHRRIMLSRAYRVVGIGIAHGTPVGHSARGRTYTADFGS